MSTTIATSTDTPKTNFSVIYNSFLSKVTDEMFLALTQDETFSMLQDLLINSISRFEFPRFNIYDYVEGSYKTEKDSNGVIIQKWDGGYFNAALTQEEVNILALSMVIEWLETQLTATDNTKLKYSGSDYKFTSQANHLSKLKVMIDSWTQKCFHMQRLYKRRRFVDGRVKSTMNFLMKEVDEPLTEIEMKTGMSSATISRILDAQAAEEEEEENASEESDEETTNPDSAETETADETDSTTSEDSSADSTTTEESNADDAESETADVTQSSAAFYGIDTNYVSKEELDKWLQTQ